MRFETTVQRPVEARGRRVTPAECRSNPHPAGSRSTGIVFVRTDLDNFAIPASWRNVARVSYATSLMRQGVLISTTEHLLSVLYSMGIDNAYIEIDNLEVPILDGSGSRSSNCSSGGDQNLPAQAALPAHPAAGFGGRQGEADHDSAGGRFPAHLRHLLSAPRWAGSRWKWK